MDKKFFKSGLELRSNSNFRSNALVATYVCDPKDVSYEALSGLSLMLKLASKAYKDEHGFLIRMMDLCDSALNFSAFRFLDKYIFEVTISCPVDKYVGNVFPSLQGKILDTYAKVLTKGFLEDKVSLTLTQGKLLRENADYENDPSWLCLDGLKKNFFPGINFGFLPNGNDTKIKSLTFEDLHKALQVVKKAKAYVGVVGFEKKGSRIHKLFSLEDGPLTFESQNVMNDKPQDLRLVKDGITSSAVAIGYAIDLPMGTKGMLMRPILRNLLSDDSSPLFLGLREERGLTYGVRTLFPEEASLLVVSMTLDKENAQASIVASDQILSSVADKITEERLEEVKRTLSTALEGSLDSPFGFANFLVSSLMVGLPTNVEDYIKLVNSLTLGEIKEVLASIRKCGSFTVDPSEEK